jgi:hypothetical protein
VKRLIAPPAVKVTCLQSILNLGVAANLRSKFREKAERKVEERENVTG